MSGHHHPFPEVFIPLNRNSVPMEVIPPHPPLRAPGRLSCLIFELSCSRNLICRATRRLSFGVWPRSLSIVSTGPSSLWRVSRQPAFFRLSVLRCVRRPRGLPVRLLGDTGSTCCEGRCCELPRGRRVLLRLAGARVRERSAGLSLQGRLSSAPGPGPESSPPRPISPWLLGAPP